MDRRRGDIVQQDDTLRKARADLAVPNDPIHFATARQASRLVEVDEPVIGKLRVERKAQQACLALGVHIVEREREFGGAGADV